LGTRLDSLGIGIDHPDAHLAGGHPIRRRAPDPLKPLPAQRPTGNDMRMLRAVLEQFWPSRRMDAFDQFCS
jgi:hypothetical protein